MLTVLERLLLPPGGPLLLAAVGLLVARRRPRAGHRLVALALVLLWVLALPLGASLLLGTLEDAPLSPEDAARAGAIVVLGGDVAAEAPEYGGATVAALTLERLRYGAHLARDTGLPVLVTGGIIYRDAPPVGELMADALAQDYGVTARWVEPLAHDTRENARRSARLLADDGIDTVLLVTHAWHMPRARAVFEAAGLDVIPAPTMFSDAPETLSGVLLPSARALRASSWALHEWLGRLWYAVTG